MSWFLNPAKAYPLAFAQKAKAYQSILTKPQGSLGEMEDCAVRFSAYQQTLQPKVEHIEIVVMAADHGVVEEGVSSFPQAVTAQMIENFSQGGAAIAVLARMLQAKLTVFNLGTVAPLKPLPRVIDVRIDAGTQNFTQTSAMTQAGCEKALYYGKEAAESAQFNQCQLFVGGEMGIGNTTAASALACAILNESDFMVGPGTGLDQEGVRHKAEVIKKALKLHQNKEPLAILKNLGGFEIAALAGAYISCAQRGIPSLLDGFISTVAALVAVTINPSIKPWLIASHHSQEPGHKLVLAALDVSPLVDLKMRLGEASGAAIVVPLIQSACRLQAEMATFESAKVSQS